MEREAYHRLNRSFVESVLTTTVIPEKWLKAGK
jgi:hypothetical protein